MAIKTELRTSIKRLKKLAQVLANVPKHLWEMGDFGEGGPKCKTACCVLGHAAYTPEFKSAGLKWKRQWDGTYHIVYNNALYDDAGREFFGLTDEEADNLFMSGMDMTRGEKVEQVLELIERREQELANA